MFVLKKIALAGILALAATIATAASPRTYFEASSSGDVAKWGVVLVPRQAQLMQFLKRLQLAGGEFVDSIRIEPDGDDFTHIAFRKSRGDAALTEVEAQLFSRE